MDTRYLCHYGGANAIALQCRDRAICRPFLNPNISMDNDNWLRQLIVMGIGTTTLIAETLSEVSAQWVRDGKIDPDQARELVDELMGRLRSDAGELEGQMERQMRNVMQDMGVARQTEVDELRGRVDRLERQVRDLENKLWRKRTSHETNLD